MNIINKNKWGDCSQCGRKNVACVKVAKSLYCIDSCHTKNKLLKSIERAKIKNNVRSLPHITESQKKDMDSRSSLTQDLDYTFSRYIRILYSDITGRVKCYTCKCLPKHWTIMQCGHFIKRGNMGLRWSVDNCRVQCKTCNEFKDGMYLVFRENLEKEEVGLADRLEQQSREIEQITNSEISQMIIDYRFKLRLVEKKIIQEKKIK